MRWSCCSTAIRGSVAGPHADEWMLLEELVHCPAQVEEADAGAVPQAGPVRGTVARRDAAGRRVLLRSVASHTRLTFCQATVMGLLAALEG